MTYQHTIFVVCVSLAWFVGLSSGQAVPETDLQAARALEGVMVAAIGTAEKSVVAIARGSRGGSDELRNVDFVPFEYGTGVVVDRNGLILTNYHVLGDPKKDQLTVWIAGQVYSSVRIKAADPWTDLAVLEVKASDLTPIEFGSSKDLKKGRIVIALGNPYAIARDGNVSATWGIVSNVRRAVDGPLANQSKNAALVPIKDRQTRYHFGGLIQTDCKLVRGTSGGPLLSLDGKMVGLTTNVAMLAGFEKGTGYAIPVDDVFLRVVEKLKRGEEIEQGFLGVAPRNPDARSGEEGVVLERVELGTPAGNSGLRAYDQIVGIDEHPVRNTNDLFRLIGSLPPEHTAKLTVVRGERRFTREVQLMKKGTFHLDRKTIATATVDRWRGLEVDYATTVSPLRISSLDPNGAITVRAVEEDSPAWKAGLRKGMMVSHVDKRRVKRPADFFKEVESLAGSVKLWTIDRSGRSMVVVTD